MMPKYLLRCLGIDLHMGVRGQQLDQHFQVNLKLPAAGLSRSF
jgi:hypothetical protein